MKMKACENHNDSIVIFNGDSCPFCKMAKSLKTIGEEIEKSMVVMKQLKMAAEEAGLKSD